MSTSTGGFLEPLGNEAEVFFSHISTDLMCLGICVLVWALGKKWRSRKQVSKVGPQTPKALKVAEHLGGEAPAREKTTSRNSAAKTFRKNQVTPLQELLTCTDRQRGYTLELYQKYRDRIDWTPLKMEEKEKAFFNFCMAAARQGDMDALQMLLQDMGKAEVPRTAELYTNVCKMITSKRLFAEALTLWRWMRKDEIEADRSTWSCLLFAAAQAKENEVAMMFFTKLHGANSAQAADYGNACRVLIATRRTVEAALLVKEMHEKNIEPYRVTYQMVFTACCAGGLHLDHAVEMMPHMRKVQDVCDSVMYNTLIKGHVQANRFDDALIWFASMREDGISPSSFTFGILLDACIESGKMDKALQVFKHMRAQGVEMNAVLITTMIKGLSKAGKPKEALELYETMLSQGIEPDLFLYSTLIKVLCDSKELETAFKVLDKMSSAGIAPDEVVFNHLLSGCIHVGNHTLGEQLLQDMMKLGIKPSVATMSIMLKLYFKCQAFPKAIEFLKSMKARFGVAPEPRLYIQFINTCLSVRRGSLALETLSVMRDSFGKPSEADVAKFIALGVQFRLLEESVQIAKRALKDGVRVESRSLDSIIEAASKLHNKAVITSAVELAKQYKLRLQATPMRT